jgi:hypothetical protein
MTLATFQYLANQMSSRDRVTCGMKFGSIQKALAICFSTFCLFSSFALPRALARDVAVGLNVLNPDRALDAEMKPLMLRLRQGIEGEWRPNSRSKDLKAKIFFRLSPGGQLLLTRVEHTSGDDQFDQTAIRAIEGTTPFAQLPSRSGEPLDIVATFNSSYYSPPRYSTGPTRSAPITPAPGYQSQLFQNQRQPQPSAQYPIYQQPPLIPARGPFAPLDQGVLQQVDKMGKEARLRDEQRTRDAQRQFSNQLNRVQTSPQQQPNAYQIPSEQTSDAPTSASSAQVMEEKAVPGKLGAGKSLPNHVQAQSPRSLDTNSRRITHLAKTGSSGGAKTAKPMAKVKGTAVSNDTASTLELMGLTPQSSKPTQPRKPSISR